MLIFFVNVLQWNLAYCPASMWNNEFQASRTVCESNSHTGQMDIQYLSLTILMSYKLAVSNNGKIDRCYMRYQCSFFPLSLFKQKQKQKPKISFITTDKQMITLSGHPVLRNNVCRLRRNRQGQHIFVLKCFFIVYQIMVQLQSLDRNTISVLQLYGRSIITRP